MPGEQQPYTNGVSTSPPAPAHRVLPNNPNAEAAILGGVIVWNELLEHLVELETDDFYGWKHKVVWQAIRNLQTAGKPLDVVTVEAEIERQGKNDAVGGIAFLGELTLSIPTPDNLKIYRDEVRLHARRRRAILELNAAAEAAWNWPHEPSEMISELTGRLQRIELAAPGKRLRMVSVAESLEDLRRLALAPIYTTPFPALNEAIGFGGFLGTQAYVVSAGTGRGKTTFVAALAAHSAGENVPVLVVSYEMRPGYFVARKAAGVLGVHSNAILRNEIDMALVLAAMPYPRMFLMHKPPLSELRAAVEYLTKKYGTPPLVIVDYIQKLADEIAMQQQRPDLRIATSQASATLIDIAETTGAAVIAVSAVGRGKGRAMQTPRKFDPYELVEVAKESGAIEFDCAAMIVLTLSKEYDADGDRIATITLAKVRFGEECHIDARYNGRRGSWRSLERVDPDAADDIDAAAAATSPAEPEVSNADLRKRLAIALNKLPAKNKTQLIDRVIGNKQQLRKAFDQMVTEGLIQKIGTGIGLTSPGIQTLMEGV